MVDHFFLEPLALRRLRAGPLGEHIDGFAALLLEQGYARQSAKTKIRLVGELSRWLQRMALGVGDLDEQRVLRFLQYKRRHGRVHRGYAATLQVLLEHLRHAKAIPDIAAEDDKPVLRPVERAFAQYLSQERGLSQATLRSYLPFIRCFLSDHFGTDPIRCMTLDVPAITGFLRRHLNTLSLGSRKLMVTALRSFFRFLRLRGDIGTDLAAAVPTVARWRLSTVPRSLKPEQVKSLLESCNQATATGQRDYALLLLLARLGLRAGEVVAMRLEDIDWEAGELSVRGKDSQRERLPVPQDVGEELAKYLRYVRPRCSTRRVFIRMMAPHQGFASSVAVCTIVRRAIDRAGLHPPYKGAHLLRHSLATQMLRKGASLAEIGEILRHRAPNTTEVYAKVDLAALHALAQPWPGGRA
jgi:site-specific recombinase XerD